MLATERGGCPYNVLEKGKEEERSDKVCGDRYVISFLKIST